MYKGNRRGSLSLVSVKISSIKPKTKVIVDHIV